jgi:hypothetical protein
MNAPVPDGSAGTICVPALREAGKGGSYMAEPVEGAGDRSAGQATVQRSVFCPMRLTTLHSQVYELLNKVGSRSTCRVRRSVLSVRLRMVVELTPPTLDPRIPEELGCVSPAFARQGLR